MISRDEALKILEELLPNQNIRKHLLATEAVMRALAKRFEPGKEDEWAMAGILHDGDYNDSVPHNLQGIEISNILEKRGIILPETVKHAMAAHNSSTGVLPGSKMDWALFACDSLTGLIVATALIRPDPPVGEAGKKLESVAVESVVKKFKDPSFARGTRREDIKTCEENLGLTLEEFIGIGIEAMKKISADLGL